ncbi:MAG: 50S ribosome-binding GTPase, partial [Planctomycetota bacterium]|nr:50S ribosome-binding GTPase [Planctomycetota bacterium]
RPKIANYPFTTLNPCLGIWDSQSTAISPLVLADIPGLIEGAADGKGLGHKFLRHVERTRVLLHLVDCSSDAENPYEDWLAIRKELEAYSGALAKRPTVLVASKIEDEEAEARARSLFEKIGSEGHCLSSVTGRGLEELRTQLLREVSEISNRP